MIVELMLFVLLVVVLRLLFFKTNSEKLYAKIPGPRPYPIFGNIFEFNSKEEASDTLKRLALKYGPVFLIKLASEPVVCIKDLADIETVLSNNSIIDKPKLYDVYKPWVNNGLFTSGGEEWRKQRKILTPAFHVSVLQSFIPIFEKNSRIFEDELWKNSGKEFDVTPFAGQLTFNVICETGMGLHTKDVVDKSKVINSYDELTKIITHRNTNFVKRSCLFNLLPDGRRHNHLITYLHGVTETMIQFRKETLFQDVEATEKTTGNCGAAQKKPFLDLLLEYSAQGANLTDLEIRQQVDTFMVAGYDTTQFAIAFTLYALAHHPQVQMRAYEEVTAIFGESDKDATYQDLQEMKYLGNVIKEVLRVYPLSRLFARKTSGEVTLKSGYTIPANSTVVVLAEVMYEDPEVYPEPSKFDPDRFDSMASKPYSFLTFGGGPRLCIGQRFATLEIKSAVSRILRRFHILPSKVPLVLKYDLILKTSSGIYIKLKHR